MAYEPKDRRHGPQAPETVRKRGMRSAKKQTADVQGMVSKLLQDRNRVERLLGLEKQRRGVPTDDLVFVGMSNVALHWWCTEEAVLKSRAEEVKFFATYLQDRIEYASRLGLIDNLPVPDEEVLDVGREITLSNVEGLHEGDHKVWSDRREAGIVVEVIVPYKERIDQGGNRTRFINPDLPQAEKTLLEKDAEAHGIRVMTDPLVRGEFLEGTRAEKYPHLRWNFTRGKYTVIGVADGITKELVYEFKTTKNRYFLSSMKPVAVAQADLYGYFFHRPRKRVQIHIVEEGKTETYDEPVDVARAEETLTAFARVDAGEPPHLPKPWKCRICKFRAECSFSQVR